MTFTTVDIKNIGDNQTINIPKEMMINDDKVIVRKLGNALYVVPYKNPWENLINSLESFTSDFMDSREQPDWDKKELSIE
jgi:antitoxin VapB